MKYLFSTWAIPYLLGLLNSPRPRWRNKIEEEEEERNTARLPEGGLQAGELQVVGVTLLAGWLGGGNIRETRHVRIISLSFTSHCSFLDARFL